MRFAAPGIQKPARPVCEGCQAAGGRLALGGGMQRQDCQRPRPGRHHQRRYLGRIRCTLATQGLRTDGVQVVAPSSSAQTKRQVVEQVHLPHAGELRCGLQPPPPHEIPQIVFRRRARSHDTLGVGSSSGEGRPDPNRAHRFCTRIRFSATAEIWRSMKKRNDPEPLALTYLREARRARMRFRHSNWVARRRRSSRKRNRLGYKMGKMLGRRRHPQKHGGIHRGPAMELSPVVVPSVARTGWGMHAPIGCSAPSRTWLCRRMVRIDSHMPGGVSQQSPVLEGKKAHSAQAQDVADGRISGAHLVFRQLILEQSRTVCGADDAVTHVSPSPAVLAAPGRTVLRVPKALRAMDRICAQPSVGSDVGCGHRCIVVAVGRTQRPSRRPRPLALGGRSIALVGRSIELERRLAKTHSAPCCVRRATRTGGGKGDPSADVQPALQATCDKACAGDHPWQVIAQNKVARRILFRPVQELKGRKSHAQAAG